MRNVKYIIVLGLLVAIGLLVYTPVKYVGASDDIVKIKKSIAVKNAQIERMGGSSATTSITISSDHGQNVDQSYQEWMGNGREFIYNYRPFTETTTANIVLSANNNTENVDYPAQISWQMETNYERLAIEILAVLLITGLLSIITYKN